MIGRLISAIFIEHLLRARRALFSALGVDDLTQISEELFEASAAITFISMMRKLRVTEVVSSRTRGQQAMVFLLLPKHRNSSLGKNQGQENWVPRLRSSAGLLCDAGQVTFPLWAHCFSQL